MHNLIGIFFADTIVKQVKLQVWFILRLYKILHSQLLSELLAFFNLVLFDCSEELI